VKVGKNSLKNTFLSQFLIAPSQMALKKQKVLFQTFEPRQGRLAYFWLTSL
jgi:hypothetical protein